MGFLARISRATPLLSRVARLARRGKVGAAVAVDPRAADQINWLQRGLSFTRGFPKADHGVSERADNALRAFFDARLEGRGIWKWDHYFDVYDRHLRDFRGREVHALEIGVYSGGSLDMWHEYFGSGALVYGVDIDETCMRFADESTRIFIGDQADREFWRRFRTAVPRLDVVIDDGGHEVHQQVVTLEELLPHLTPAGVYICEDIHGSHNGFGAYIAGLVQGLNASVFNNNLANPDRRLVSRTTGFQSRVASVHSYPFATVIETRAHPVPEFVAPQHGSEWGSGRR
jgi:hypothetical protein